MNFFLKIIVAILLVINYFVIAIPLYPLFLISDNYMRKFLNIIASFHCKLMLKNLGISIEHNIPHHLPSKGYLVVCNHLSYLDIFILNSVLPCCFVTSIEMKQTPGLGHICTLGGCLFVERRSRNNIVNEVKEIEGAISCGLNVAFYPEAKSTEGIEVLPFKRSLFQAAVNIKADTAVFALNYLSLNDEPVNSQNKNFLFWYDNMGFASHFINLCKQKKVHASLNLIEVVESQQCSDDSGILRNKAFHLVSSNYRPIK